ncbi:MAG: hypothetical protein LC799_25865, partial [Actinobacteria bacterium]|nr:hypothetical protein [Actinomycetota bacterium]
MRSHRLVVGLSALASVVLLGGVPTASATTAPYCGITWGSQAKSNLAMTPAPIVGARVGRHDCWDRLVIDVSGSPAPGFNVRYTDGFHNSASEAPIPVSGGAVLTVAVRAPDYDINTGQSTVPWRYGTHIMSPARFSS